MLPKFVLDQKGNLLCQQAREGEGAVYLPVPRHSLPAKFYDCFTQRWFILNPDDGKFYDPDWEKNLYELEQVGEQKQTEAQKKELETQKHLQEFYRMIAEKHPRPEEIKIGGISGHCKTPQRTLNWPLRQAPQHSNPDLEQGLLIGGLRAGSETVTTDSGWE